MSMSMSMFVLELYSCTLSPCTVSDTLYIYGVVDFNFVKKVKRESSDEFLHKSDARRTERGVGIQCW